jgi:hypothetical protein
MADSGTTVLPKPNHFPPTSSTSNLSTFSTIPNLPHLFQPNQNPNSILNPPQVECENIFSTNQFFNSSIISLPQFLFSFSFSFTFPRGFFL